MLFDEQAKLAHAREVGIEEGMEKGMKKGKEVGIQEGKIQLIQGMHKNGMHIEDIAKFTNMDLSDICNILEQ
ncbi:histidine kinase [Bacillus thuringiensis]|nr:histidine kinase [Bacillus thuringiensis]